MTTSVLSDAFTHHVWATERLIDACAVLTPEQLKAPVPGTYGSIIDTLRHLVRADSWYLFVLTGKRIAPIDDEGSLANLRSVIARHGGAWADILAGEMDPEADVVREEDDGSELHAPMGIHLAQAIHHGTDHRSQVCTALSSLGLTPPEIDLWSLAQATGRERMVPAPAP